MKEVAKPTGELKPAVREENGWLKFLRVAFYTVTVVGVAVGVGLLKSAAMSSAYADGSHEAKLANGLAFFIPSLILLAGNILWGMLRWFLRYSREQWKAGRVIGKMIGGGIWRTLVFVPLFIVPLLTLTPVVTNAISENLAAEQAARQPYKLNMDVAMDRLEYLNEHFDELNAEEVEAELDELTLSNIEFEAGEEVSARTGVPGLFTKNAVATTHHVATLRKAKLSSKGHFVVFYTTSGDDAITDEQAEGLGEMMEEIIESYKTRLGFEYEYEQIGVGVIKETNIMMVLKENGIDVGILKTAMPIYVANPNSGPSNVLASYAGEVFAGAWAQIGMKIGKIPFMADRETRDTFTFYESAPSFPFINIGPASVGSEDLRVVAAHEIGHHYAALSNKKIGGDGSTDDFIDETVANWMAINVVQSDFVKNTVNGDHYNDIYLGGGTTHKISDVMPGCGNVSSNDHSACNGYPSVAFLENYFEIVPDGKTKIMDAVYYGDALKNLYAWAGEENFARVMTRLAERNLTGDYGGKLVNYTLPKGENLNCTDVCSMSYVINPAATGYVYFVPEEYRDTTVSFKGGDNVTASVVGKTLAGTWTVLACGEAEIEFEITEETLSSYELLALAVSNSSVTGAGSYTVEVVKAELEDLIVEDGEFDFELEDGNILTKVGEGCYLVNTDRAFEYLNQLMGLGSELLGVLSPLDETGLFGEVKTQYDQDMATAQANLGEAKEELSPYRVTICANYIKSGSSFDAIRMRLQSAMGQNLNLYNGADGDSRVSVFVGFDVLARRAKAYALMAEGEEMGLFTIGLEEK